MAHPSFYHPLLSYSLPFFSWQLNQGVRSLKEAEIIIQNVWQSSVVELILSIEAKPKVSVVRLVNLTLPYQLYALIACLQT